jgi:hypothetical protein
MNKSKHIPIGLWRQCVTLNFGLRLLALAKFGEAAPAGFPFRF